MSEQRDGERLEMFGALQIAEVVGQIGFIARREKRRHQNQVGNALGDRGQRRVLGIREDEVGTHRISDELLDDGGLSGIRLEGQNERHRLMSSP